MVPMGEIVNSLPLTPGGLGVGETAFNAFFSIAGLRGGAEALLCWRVWNALTGLLGLFFYLRGVRVRVIDPVSSDPVSSVSTPRPPGLGGARLPEYPLLAILQSLVYPIGASNAILVLGSFCS